MYKGIVTKIKNVRAHPNADRVKLGTCHGNQVVVGLDVEEDHMGVYFACDGQLSHEFCHANDLYREVSLNKHPDEKGGMFDNNRRVRAQRFRGEISDGFWVPLHYFGFLSVSGLDVEGFEFDTWQGVPICSKYINAATIKVARENQGKKTKRAKTSKMFKEHFDTGQFNRNLHEFEKGQFIIITEKLHGCVSRDTIVETIEYGEILIGEVVDKKLNVRIKALDTESNEIVFVKIDEWFFEHDNGDWYEIEFEDGRLLRITGNNPVWLPLLKCYRKVENLIGNEILLSD